MRRNVRPDNRLDIIVPILNEKVQLHNDAARYPEVAELVTGNRVSGVQIYLVTPTSPRAVRNAAEIIGHYFRREFGYDFPPYLVSDEPNPRDRLFLLVEGDWIERTVIGAIGFTWRRYQGKPAPQRVLSWVWLHPFRRRKGILTAYWDLFRRVYGDFFVEPPYSKAMETFLKSKGAYPEEERT